MLHLKKDDLPRLLQSSSTSCVSMYLAASPRLDTPEALRRFCSELKLACRLLSTQHTAERTTALMGQIKRIYLEAIRRTPTSHVAIFASDTLSGFFPHQRDVTERTVVSSSFHVRPLLPWLDSARMGKAFMVTSDEILQWEISETGREFIGAEAYSSERLRLLLPDSRGVAVRPVFLAVDRRDRFLLAECSLMIGTERLCSTLPETARLLVRGRVDALIVNRDSRLWGTHDGKYDTLTVRPRQADARDDDLLDDMMEEALRQGVPVLGVDPALMPLARWLRWCVARIAAECGLTLPQTLCQRPRKISTEKWT